MATDFLSKFHEIFGAEQAFTSAPTLRDVVPGLIQGVSAFSSKELNKRRSAVSARNFRNPRVRSMEGAFEREGAGETGSAFVGAPSFIPQNASDFPGELRTQGGGPGPGGGIGGTGVEGGEAFGGNVGGELGEAMGNEAALSMGISGLSSAALGGAAALGLGASLGQSGSVALGSGVLGAFGGLSPLGLAGLANSLGGTVASGVIGSSVAEGYGQDPTGPVAAAAAQGASSNFGAIGMAGRGLVSALTDSVTSPTVNAQNAALAAVEAQDEEGSAFGGSIGGGMAGPTGAGGSVGPQGTPGMAGLDASPAGSGLGPAGGFSEGAVSAAGSSFGLDAASFGDGVGGGPK